MISPETLRRFPFFAGIDPTMLKEIAIFCEEVTCQEGRWLFHEGETADALYLILSGKIELMIHLDDDEGHYDDLTILVEGEVLGWSAVVEPHKYRSGAVALRNTSLVKMNGERLLELMSQHPDVGYILMSRLAQAIGTRLQYLRSRFASMMVS